MFILLVFLVFVVSVVIVDGFVGFMVVVAMVMVELVVIIRWFACVGASIPRLAPFHVLVSFDHVATDSSIAFSFHLPSLIKLRCTVNLTKFINKRLWIIL